MTLEGGVPILYSFLLLQDFPGTQQAKLAKRGTGCFSIGLLLRNAVLLYEIWKRIMSNEMKIQYGSCDKR